MLKTSHNSSDLRYELDEFTRMFRLMVSSKSPILVIGGSTVDHLAMINVVADVLGAVSVAMKHGVIVDAIPKIYTIFGSIVGVPSEYLEFINRIREFFERYTLLTYQFDVDRVEGMLAGISKLASQTTETGLSQVFFGNDTWQAIADSNIGKVRVVQSYRSFEEMFRRLVDTIPKLITIDKVIIPHGIIDRNLKE
jgi:hypothetical protein